MMTNNIDYKQILQRLAIAHHIDTDFDFWQQINISVWFGQLKKSYMDRFKRICPYLPTEYFEVISRYSGIIINKLYFYGADNISEEELTASNADICWYIASYKAMGRVCIRDNGTIWFLSEASNVTARKISNTFDEFMEECVFGERYLEFNGGDENDNAYNFIKGFKESIKEDYATLTETEILEIQNNLNQQEADIRRLLLEEEKTNT